MTNDDVPALIAALSNEDRQVRSHAATALGDIIEDVCTSAFFTLKRMGEPAVPALINGLDNQDSRIRSYAIYLLEGIGDARAVAPLIELLADNTRTRVFSLRTRRICDEAAKALEKIGTPEALAAVAAFRKRDKGG